MKINKTIIIDGLEVETKLHTEMNRISLIKIPKGWRLLNVTEFFNLYNNHFNKFDFNRLDEIIENPSIRARVKYPYWNVWLSWLDGDSVVYGDNWSLYYSVTVRGVRFCRDIIEGGK